MQRDKRGRFVKKAYNGTPLTVDGGIVTIGGKKYKLKDGEDINNILPLLHTGENQEETLSQYFMPVEEPSEPITPPTTSLNGNQSFQYTSKYSTNPSINSDLKGLKMDFSLDPTIGQTRLLDHQRSFQFNTPEMPTSNKIKFRRTKDGKYISEYGTEISPLELGNHAERYEGDFFGIGLGDDETNKQSAGVNILDDNRSDKYNNKQNTVPNKPIDKTKLANFLELTRAGIGASVNNKIANRALAAEKPFLQDISESHRSIYGDYRAQVQGEKAAAQLRNMASKPLTSDGALQQQMMMDAQIKGQQYIDQGNAQDEALIKQTRETAWQQEKENQQQRQAVAMQNRQAMLMSEKNKAQIRNMRDSANFSQVISPLLSATEQRLRNEGVKQNYYQDFYDEALVDSDVWNNYRDGLTESQKNLAQQYLLGGTDRVNAYTNNDQVKQQEWLSLKRLMDQEIMKRKARLRGVIINPTITNSKTPNFFDPSVSLFEYKKGGTIYKAKLTKRTKDNDRGAKSIESSKKIAARFLEKAIDSLYNYNDVEIIAKPGKKKRKYQAGGGLPFVNFTPVFATSEDGVPKETDEKNNKKDLTSKDVLELLKDMDGLPSDMQLIVQALQNFELQNQMDPLGMSSSSDITSRYISLINKIKVAKFNREEYNNAFNQLKGNGGLNEFAVTS